jgi:hypothetical protein
VPSKKLIYKFKKRKLNIQIQKKIKNKKMRSIFLSEK